MSAASGIFTGNIVQIAEHHIFYGEVTWQDGVIDSITRIGIEQPTSPYLIPGFVDAHLHVESSMLPPAEFARQAVRHGSVAAVCDPHEIANVLGEEGVRFMLDNARSTPFKYAFGVPSCVPATPFETAGAEINLETSASLFREPEVTHLAEMMNFPGVLDGNAAVQAKLSLAQRLDKPVDGHAPGLRGADAARYAAAGITTEHECTTIEEAIDKLDAGMHILIREGSAARNFDALHPLITSHTNQVMLCSDDKHPDDLLSGHINQMAARAVAAGHDPLAVLQCACVNPVRHYRLPVGSLHVGDYMDAVAVEDLTWFAPIKTWIEGKLVAESGRTLLPPVATQSLNRFVSYPIDAKALLKKLDGEYLRVIEVSDGELITRERMVAPPGDNGYLIADTGRDLLWLVVVNRYQKASPAVACVQGFGLKNGAIASSVAHDSHNVVAVGAEPEALCAAINSVMEQHGGVAVATDQGVDILPLPIAGLMSDACADEVGQRYAELDRSAKGLGSQLRAPFMTLSFMALLVIPELKLSDRGLFDSRIFQFTELMSAERGGDDD